jgi:hypothetical protein
LKSFIQNWGVDHPSKSTIIKEKKRETFQDRFGAQNWGVNHHLLKSGEIKERIINSNLEKWRVKWTLQSDKIKKHFFIFFIYKVHIFLILLTRYFHKKNCNI